MVFGIRWVSQQFGASASRLCLFETLDVPNAGFISQNSCFSFSITIFSEFWRNCTPTCTLHEMPITLVCFPAEQYRKDASGLFIRSSHYPFLTQRSSDMPCTDVRVLVECKWRFTRKITSTFWTHTSFGQNLHMEQSEILSERCNLVFQYSTCATENFIIYYRSRSEPVRRGVKMVLALLCMSNRVLFCL